jgi:hypothetical protein
MANFFILLLPRNSPGSLAKFAAIRRASSLLSSLAADPIGLSCPLLLLSPKEAAYLGGRHGMVQAENIDSGCSSFQLDDRSRCDHHSLAHLSKFPLSEPGHIRRASSHSPRLTAA